MSQSKSFVFCRTWVSLVVATIVASCAASADAADPPRPNIVHIFVDDLGWGDVGYNGQADILTPNIDSMAAGGLTLRLSYCPAPLCAPSRAALYSGMHNGHTLVDRNGNIAAGFSSDHVCVAEVLQTANYSTALFGKHGFGGSKPTTSNNYQETSLPTVTDVDSLPNNMGYQEFFGYLNHSRAHNYTPISLWQTDAAGADGLSQVDLDADNDGYGDQYAHDVVQQRALDYVTAHAGDDDPFYMQVNYTIPHFDIDAIRSFPGWFDDYAGVDTSGWSDKMKSVAAMITRMDSSVGEILDRLADPDGNAGTDDSILEDTLVIFWSDNGPTNEDGTNVEGFFNSNGHLRGGKRDLYEGGVHVPGIAYWAGTLAPGTLETPTDLADFLPTAAELAGVRGPVGTDGVSLAPTFTGQGLQRTRDYFIFEHHEGDGPDPGTKDARWSILRDGIKLIKFADDSYEMYDLSADPSEQTNIVGANAALKAELEAIALAEGVERPDDYAVTYRTWTGGDGDQVADATNWSGGGSPAGNWSAVLAGGDTAESIALVSSSVDTLGFEVRGGTARQTVDVAPGRTLGGRNEVRISAGGRIQLSDAVLDSNRFTDVLDGGELTGHGNVAGDVYNSGIVAPGRPADLSPIGQPPGGVDTGVVPAVVFDFTGIQDDAPLTQTSILAPQVQLAGGLDLGPGLAPRHPGDPGGSTNVGDEFNVSGFGTTSAAAANSAGDYLTFAVAPQYGLEMLLDTVSFDLWRNGVNAAKSYAILTSLDGFSDAAPLAELTDITDTSTHTISGQYTGGQWTSTEVEVRLCGFDANQASGNTHFNAAALSASFRSIPTVALDATGVLAIDGDFYHVDGAMLAMEIGGLDNSDPLDPMFDQLVVDGDVRLDGQLLLGLVEGFDPAIGDSFDLIMADSVTGTFGSESGLAINGQKQFLIQYGADRVTAVVTAVPEPGTLVLLLMGLGALVLLRSKPRKRLIQSSKTLPSFVVSSHSLAPAAPNSSMCSAIRCRRSSPKCENAGI